MEIFFKRSQGQDAWQLFFSPEAGFQGQLCAERVPFTMVTEWFLTYNERKYHIILTSGFSGVELGVIPQRSQQRNIPLTFLSHNERGAWVEIRAEVDFESLTHAPE